MKVGILGAGAFGLALSHILVKNKVTVEMWTHNEEEVKVLDKKTMLLFSVEMMQQKLVGCY